MFFPHFGNSVARSAVTVQRLPGSPAKSAIPANSAYVDTSVLGAYYCPEPFSGAAEAALLELRDACTSPLTEVEFASLIAHKQRLKELGAREAAEVLRLFGQHVSGGHYRRLPLRTGDFFRARNLIGSMASASSTVDALYLACTLAAGIPLLTADRDFTRAARRHDTSATLAK